MENLDSVLKYYADSMHSDVAKGIRIFKVPPEIQDFVDDTFDEWHQYFSDYTLHREVDGTNNNILVIPKTDNGKLFLFTPKRFEEFVQNYICEEAVVSAATEPAPVSVSVSVETGDTKTISYKGCSFNYTNEFILLQERFNRIYDKEKFKKDSLKKVCYSNKELTSFSFEVAQLLLQFSEIQNNNNIFCFSTKRIFCILTGTKLKDYSDILQKAAKVAILSSLEYYVEVRNLTS